MSYKKYYYSIIKEIKKRIIYFYQDNLISLVIFGSVAKDTFSPESDIDILIILNKRKGSYIDFSEYYDNIETNLNTLKKAKKKKLNIIINPIFKEKDKLTINTPYLWKNKFIVLYDRGNFFKNFTENLRNYEKRLVTQDNKIPYIEVRNG
ncbi:MAG: nucleotidyltransferase domain-containing protein [Brevinematales bacterium]